ncbi:hypothetical protein [Chroococcidiopsis sp.]|uniref:hypothetical protein n=1 Tax=Chroococcidiopsis sp. TaxID=3088168 RepID=UPI003F37A0B7
MDTDTDSTVYFIQRNGFAEGVVKYADGEFYCDAFNLQTQGEQQSDTVGQLARWMSCMEMRGYEFKSTETMIEEIGK